MHDTIISDWTIPTTTTKADLIIAVGRALLLAKRTDEAVTFYRAAEQARDAQEVLALIPAGLEVRFDT